MPSSDVEQVLANWIAQATTPPGRLAEGTDPARWVARQFFRWWASQAADEMAAAEGAMAAVRRELERLGGWSDPRLGEALHELIHAGDALAGLRELLGLEYGEEDRA